MNRPVSATGLKLICLAACWQCSALPAPAQIQMPAQSNDRGQPQQRPVQDGLIAAPDPTARAAARANEPVDNLLARVRAAVAQQDYVVAVETYRAITARPGKSPQQTAAANVVRDQLTRIGIDPALLKPAPAPAQPMPQVAGARPLANPGAPAATAGAPTSATPQPNNVAAAKQEASRLIAMGRHALDSGDSRRALELARQAEALRVPEAAFAAGEPRVWDLLLDAESAARRSGVIQASNTAPNSPGAVQQAFAATPAGQPGGGEVQQMLFAQDPSQSGAGAVQPVQNLDPLPPGPTPASQSFAEGMQALASGDKEMARSRFKEAWRNESQLSEAERAQLKDKLTLLQPKRLGAPAAENQELSAIQKANLESQEKTRRLFREVTSELVKAEEAKATAPLDVLDNLERLRRRVDGSSVEDQSKRSLARMVDRAISDQRSYVEANRAQIDLEIQNDAVRTEMANDQAREMRIDDEVSSLVNTFNDLIEARRFQEAEVIAKQVQMLKPDDTIAISMFHTSRMGTRLLMDEEVRNAKELAFIDSMIDVDRSSIALDPSLPLTMPDAREWEALSRQRLGGDRENDGLSVVEREIKNKMSTPVSVKFTNRPLGEVLDDLSAMTGIAIVVDERALASVRVSSDTPVNLTALNDIRLESVLNLILEPKELTYMIDNDVLQITSIEAKRSNVFPRTYRVADLVTPIPNFTSSYENGLAGAIRAAYQMTNPQPSVQVVPVSAMDLGMELGRSMSPTYMGSDVLGQYQQMGSQGGFGGASSPVAGSGGGAFADFQSLIQLIQQTVSPDSWEEMGGSSTMVEYAQNLSLVISTTSEVHDQITELLESLRRLQNLQITIEVRFITLADTFAEQIGIDFDFQFDDNVTSLPTDDAGPSVVIGFDGVTGTPTADLDIQFDNESFGLTPPFGGVALGDPSTIGFAILSDIEAFFFLQAAQADSRSNIMQAPKVTMFDGQIAFINDTTARPFVTSITPVVGDFAVAQQPVIVVLNEGTQLNVQGIVSDDKRFVRLTLVPFFSQIGDVDTFTFEGSRTTTSTSRVEVDTNGDGVIDELDAVATNDEADVIQGTTVQLPTFASTSVSTTVSVPDGGTILLGGIKRMSEGRAERGVPILSKIPYVSRLFRNVSAGRTSTSLMLMVTPRIIIQEEEELAQTGFAPNQQ